VVRQHLLARDIPCVYGDIGHPDTMHHAAIEHAQVVLCTVPDSVLKGVSNLKLLRMLKELCPGARRIMTAESPAQAQALYAEGADFVLMPAVLTGEALVNVVELALRGEIEDLTERGRDTVKARREILSA
jgi:Trk K+ transport system NAD-binding subunit